MTSIGFHYFPDENHYRQVDLQAWLPELQALGARWLTLVGSLTRAVPEPFIRGLVAAGIEPIIHIPAAPFRAVDLSALRPLLESYERWGVKHVVVFDEPNTRARWPASEWGKTALVERFLDLLVPVLLAQAEAGLQPTFPPLKAGGEYWDTAFLEAALAGMARRGLNDLLKHLSFAVNLWTFNRPVDWGAGGLKQWPEARPYRTPPGSQDQRGFCLFDWHNEIISARLGEARPLLCLAGGPRLGDLTDPASRSAALDETRHASCTKEIAQLIADQRLPGNLLNVNFWLIGAADGSPFAREAWYRSDGTTLAAVETLKQFQQEMRKSASQGPAPLKTGRVLSKIPFRGETRPVWAEGRRSPSGGGKPLQHYLLLPTFEWGISEWHWNAALNFVKTHRPACGFSADEARQARLVTILGNEQGVSREVEAALREAGCEVRRIQVSGDGKVEDPLQGAVNSNE